MPNENDGSRENQSDGSKSSNADSSADTDRTSSERDTHERSDNYGEKDFGLGGDRYVKELGDMLRDSDDWGRDLKDKADVATGERIDRDVWAKLDAQFNNDNADRAFGLTKSDEWIRLSSFAELNGFYVTFATAGTHNQNSAHYTGNAIDVRTWDHSPEEADQFIQDARNEGFNVNDERVRPPNQKVWDGPHLHISDKDKSPYSINTKFK